MENNSNETLKSSNVEIEEESPETFNKLKSFLDERGIEYTLMEHLPAKTSEEAAIIRNTSLESGAKALILKADKNFVLLILSAAFKFNSKLAKKLLKAKSLRFAEISEVKSLTGCINGAVPPFGSLFNLKTFVDESLYKQGDTISFNAGLRTKSMIMKTEDYKTYENPILINISEDDNNKI